MKKMIIAAGTGFLGSILSEYFKNKVDEIIILTRGKSRTTGNIKYVHWNARTFGNWETELENSDVLINLAGKSVNCRYNERNKNEIMASRLNSTAILNKAVLQCKNPPKHWLNSSTATIYKGSYHKQMDEVNGDKGFDFSMKVARAWEKVFFKTETQQTLKTALRTSIVLGKNGGAYPMLRKLAKIGMGGKQGNGRQYVSWIHEHDFARAVEFVINTKTEGVINIVSPTPIRNNDFMKTIVKQVKAPFAIPVSKTMLEIGAQIIGTETELILKSRNVIPKRLQENGFTFTYPELSTALRNL
ncbi:NAD-dependent epimerase [Flavobacterium beibuense F44-8]|uniref:NAD-dependent epimerase n=1 Tax=Flavobacterium beibuense F44-8 TaxID=1406840 RepID=A0A0A2LY02_9FLAO|nr:TIGR01777 family oxidoreductase [Flavobacterium beibuense]KGO84191.1 NAD-dependent epimerase [Flavobacterium beibuense F44-8]